MPLLNFDRTLVWSDYPPPVATAPAGAEPDAHAYTFVELLTQNARLVRIAHGVKIDSIDLNISFTRRKSWVLASHAGQANLLKHEQGHYDITALIGREVYAQILNLNATDNHQLTLDVQAVLDRYRRQIRLIYDRYDAQTRHGANRDAQRRWNAAFEAQKALATGNVNGLPQ